MTEATDVEYVVVATENDFPRRLKWKEDRYGMGVWVEGEQLGYLDRTGVLVLMPGLDKENTGLQTDDDGYVKVRYEGRE